MRAEARGAGACYLPGMERLVRAVTLVSVLGWLGLLLAPVPWVLGSTPTGFLPKPGYEMGHLLLLGAGVTLLAMVAAALPKRAAVLVGAVPAAVSALLCAWMWGLIAFGNADPAVRAARESVLGL